MIKKLLIYKVIFLLVVLSLIFYNYQKAQTALRQARETRLSIEFAKIPDTLKINQSGAFSWKVDAPNSFSTKTTGIYWNYESSPSALTKYDSPKAVAYHNYTEDYSTGLFRLPDTFDLNLKFSRAGVVYLRAYALIDNDHLWTQERQIKIISDEK